MEQKLMKLDVKELGHRIRVLRVQHGETGKDLSKGTGLSQATLSKMENAKIENPSTNSIRSIALYYKVSTNFLLYGIEKKDDPSNSNEDHILQQLDAERTKVDSLQKEVYDLKIKLGLYESLLTRQLSGKSEVAVNPQGQLIVQTSLFAN